MATAVSFSHRQLSSSPHACQGLHTNARRKILNMHLPESLRAPEHKLSDTGPVKRRCELLSPPPFYSSTHVRLQLSCRNVYHLDGGDISNASADINTEAKSCPNLYVSPFLLTPTAPSPPCLANITNTAANAKKNCMFHKKLTRKRLEKRVQ